MEYIPIREVADVKSGFAFKSDNYLSEGIPLVRIGNLDGNDLVFNEDTVCVDEKFATEYSEFLLNENDVLIAMSGATTGKLALVKKEDTPCLLNQRVGKFSVNDKRLDSKYLFYFLSMGSIKDGILKVSGGSAQPNVSPNQLKEIKIPLPDLKTQHKIAGILAQADAARQKRKQANQLTEQFLQSAFLEMFGDPVRNEKGWEVIDLGNLCDVGSSRRVFVEELVENGIPFFRGTEIGQLAEATDVSPSLFITDKHYEDLKSITGVPSVGDLLMPSICPDGRIFRVVNDSPFYFKDGRVLWVKASKCQLKSEYLQNALKWIFILNYEKIASGITFAELKIIALKKIKVPIPPLPLQQKFAALVEQVERLRTKQRESERELDNLFQSLMQKYFG